MRIPQHFHTPGWQRFTSGLIIGIIIGWVFFVVISGETEDNQLTMISKQKATIKQLQKELKTWQEESNEKNKKIEKKLTIQSIDVEFADDQDSGLGKSELYDLQGEVKDQLSSIIRQDIETVAENRQLIMHLIENKTYTIEKNKYQLKVVTLVVYSTMQVVLDVEKV
ncbi:MAG TPA: sporulation membrane protein YtrI [Bacillales bacterium]|nr:sporulation membrane protein YtrI [Bacillales bacterium]